MLYMRAVSRALAIFGLLLGTMSFADAGGISHQAVMPPNVMHGMPDDGRPCDRGSLDTAACQAICASIAAVPAAAVVVAAPAHEKGWTTAAEAGWTGLEPLPDPRPPEHRRLT
jgi:hypothetical protein